MLTFLSSLVKCCYEPLYVSRYLEGRNRSGVSQCSATFHQVVFYVRYSKNSLEFLESRESILAKNEITTWLFLSLILTVEVFTWGNLNSKNVDLYY